MRGGSTGGKAEAKAWLRVRRGHQDRSWWVLPVLVSP